MSTEAYAFIDFLLRPDIAARNTNTTNFANGVLASQALVSQDILNNKSIYPDRGHDEASLHRHLL